MTSFLLGFAVGLLVACVGSAAIVAAIALHELRVDRRRENAKRLAREGAPAPVVDLAARRTRGVR